MDMVPCQNCDGRGTYDYFALGMRYPVRCDYCDGTGQAYPEPEIETTSRDGTALRDWELRTTRQPVDIEDEDEDED